MKQPSTRLNVGHLLYNHLKYHRITGEDLADLIGKTGQSVSLYKGKAGMRTELLEEICYALEHNFFQDLANQLPQEFTIDPYLNTGHRGLLEQLQEENKVLQIQNELLMRLKG